MGGRTAVCLAIATTTACLSAPPGATGEDAAVPGPDAAEFDAGPAPCTPFEDDFEDAPLNTVLWEADSEEGGKVQVEADALVLEVALPTAYTYVDVHAKPPTSLTGFSVVVDVAVTVSGEGDAAIALTSPISGHYVGMSMDSGLLLAIRDNGTYESFCADSCPVYTYPDQRFWRIEERAGDLHFEFSADKVTWEVLADPLPVPGGDHQVYFWAEAGPGNRVTSAIARVTASCP